jgi:hypothetical protein
MFLYPDLMMKVRLSEKVSLRYIHLCAVAPHARAYFSTHASGAQATMPKINQGILAKLPIALPPLAEQQRIVAKVEELMGICDRLEGRPPMLMSRVAGCSKPSSTMPSLTPLRASLRQGLCPRPIFHSESLPSNRATNGSDQISLKNYLL